MHRPLETAAFHYRLQDQGNRVFIADPAEGLLTCSRVEFAQGWATTVRDQLLGVVLLLQPTPSFYEIDTLAGKERLSWHVLRSYLSQDRAFLVQLIAGMVCGTLLALLFPLTTQALVDPAPGRAGRAVETDPLSLLTCITRSCSISTGIRMNSATSTATLVMPPRKPG